MYVLYDSNNSGGSWWLGDEQWKALEAAGWKVAWERLEHVYAENGGYELDPDGTPKLVPVGAGNGKYKSFARRYESGEYRFLGALATRAYRAGLSLREAAEEWERVTSKSSTDAGCPCCGPPHTFIEYDDEGNYVADGPDVSYEAHW